MIFGALGYGCLWQVWLGRLEFSLLLLFAFVCYWFAVD